MKISTTEAQEIIRGIEDIPPLLWLFYCKEPDQRKEWANLKTHFQTLHDSLKAYFSGEETPLQALPKKQKKFYAEWMDYYLAVYDVLQWGWKYIKKADPELPFESPGQTLIAIIEADAAGMFTPCQLGYIEWSSKSTYEEHRLRKKRTAALARGETLDKHQQSKLSKLSAVSEKRDTYADPLLSLLKSCLAACQVGAQRDPTMRRKLQDVRKYSDTATDTLVTSLLRLSQGHAWDKGKKKGWAPGGVYK